MTHLAWWPFIVLAGAGVGVCTGLFGVGGSSVATPVLALLGYVKLRLAGQLRSRALRGDGVLSSAGAALAAMALADLAVDRSLGWWWADPAAGSLIASLLLREGWRMRGEPGQPEQRAVKGTR